MSVEYCLKQVHASVDELGSVVTRLIAKINPILRSDKEEVRGEKGIDSDMCDVASSICRLGDRVDEAIVLLLNTLDRIDLSEGDDLDVRLPERAKEVMVRKGQRPHEATNPFG